MSRLSGRMYCAFAIGLLSVGSVRASTLVYEGFNGYSSFAAGTTPNSNTIGLNQSIAYAGTAPDSLTVSAGLTLSNLQVSGSSAGFSGGTIVAGAQLTQPAPYVGTLYSSYLINLTGRGTVANGGNGAELRLSNDDSTGGARFRALADSRNSSINTQVLANGYDTASTDATTAIAASTTYLIISRFQNVGSANSTGPGTSWALSAAQFDSFISGGGDDAYLDNATIGTAANQVTAAVTDTATSGTYSFAAGNRVQFVEVGDSGRVDELRFGTTLADVTPTPEPGSIALAGGSGLLLLLRRRRASVAV